MLEQACAGFDNVRVESFSGLLTDFCRAHDVHAIVKGLRAVSDFDYELQMAQMNASLAEEVETVFVPTAPEYSFLASSLVKEVARFGGDVSAVPPRLRQRGAGGASDQRDGAAGGPAADRGFARARGGWVRFSLDLRVSTRK